MILDTLPERPITRDEFDQITEADSIAEGYVFAEHGGSGGQYVLQFALDLGDEHVGVHFDPHQEDWRLVDRSVTFEEVSTALSSARND